MLVVKKGFLFLMREARIQVMVVMTVDDVRSSKREVRQVGARLRLHHQRRCGSARLLPNRAL
jgi:hypothetical protein